MGNHPDLNYTEGQAPIVHLQTDLLKTIRWADEQAEFLLWESFPWELVEKIGVIDVGRGAAVRRVLARATHRPSISVEPGWYY
jgi:hypothetical protein